MTAGILQAHWSRKTQTTHTSLRYITRLSPAALVGNYKLKRGKVNANRQNFDLENSKGNVEVSYLLGIDISHFCQEVCINNSVPSFRKFFFLL